MHNSRIHNKAELEKISRV